jgi:hypothetical protein
LSIGPLQLAMSLPVAALLAGIAPQPGQAQLSCAPHEDVARLLGRDYGESPVAFGVTGEGRLVEVFSSEGGGTWTIVLTTGSGQACIMASGSDWATVPLAVVEKTS